MEVGRVRETVDGAVVIIAGFFSAKRRDHADLMAELEAEVTSLGGVVSEIFVQRRGISGNKKGNAPGGRAAMDRPYSSRTLMSDGKIREMAEARERTGAAAVIFHNDLTDRQRKVLTDLFACPVFTLQDVRRRR